MKRTFIIIIIFISLTSLMCTIEEINDTVDASLIGNKYKSVQLLEENMEY